MNTQAFHNLLQDIIAALHRELGTEECGRMLDRAKSACDALEHPAPPTPGRVGDPEPDPPRPPRPPCPEGYEFTGEYRVPRQGEWYMALVGPAAIWNEHEMRWILCPKPAGTRSVGERIAIEGWCERWGPGRLGDEIDSAIARDRAERGDLPIDPLPCEAGPPVVLLKLSAYELVNLRAGLGACVLPGPLQVLNTGDWLGAIKNRLDAIPLSPTSCAPNRGPDEIARMARAERPARTMSDGQIIALWNTLGMGSNAHQNAITLARALGIKEPTP